METILNKIEEQLSEVDKQLESFSSLNKISKKVNIRVSLLAFITILLSCIICYITMGPSLLANLVGVIYPIYNTLSILQNHTEEEYVDCIMYWMVFGILYIADVAIPTISHYLPFFYPFKVSVLLSCISKDTNLSGVIYDNIFAGYLGYPDTIESKRMKVVEEIKESDSHSLDYKKSE